MKATRTTSRPAWRIALDWSHPFYGRANKPSTYRRWGGETEGTSSNPFEHAAAGFEYLRIPSNAPRFNTCQKGIIVLDSVMFNSNSAILYLLRPTSSARARAAIPTLPRKKCQRRDAVARVFRPLPLRPATGPHASSRTVFPTVAGAPFCSSSSSAFAAKVPDRRSFRSAPFLGAPISELAVSDTTPAKSALTKSALLTSLESALTKIVRKSFGICTYKKMGEG
jgi:hypothetical protein